MQNRQFPTIQELIRSINESAQPLDWLGLVDAAIDAASDDEVDLYGLLEVLRTGIVSTIMLFPPDKRSAAGAAAIQLLMDRLSANGVG
jgi:hypothetical protein